MKELHSLCATQSTLFNSMKRAWLNAYKHIRQQEVTAFIIH